MTNGATMKALAAPALALLAALVPLAAEADSSAIPDRFAPIGFLIGDWQGSGVSDVGPGAGTDSFHLDIGDRTIVRRSQALYEAKDGKPGGTYSSMMVIYTIGASVPQIRADYYDSGGHVIHYSLGPNSDPHVAQFVSDPTPTGPTFRLTYTDAPDDKTMHVRFELAPPGSTAFTTTIAEGTDTRKP